MVGRVALNHSIEVRILAGQQAWGISEIGCHGSLALSRKGFESSILHIGLVVTVKFKEGTTRDNRALKSCHVNWDVAQW